jgi:hypothetical protein
MKKKCREKRIVSQLETSTSSLKVGVGVDGSFFDEKKIIVSWSLPYQTYFLCLCVKFWSR